MNFRYRIMQFMSGRYGPDKLSNMLLVISAILSVINIFLRFYHLQLLVYFIIIYVFFRMLSRNIEGRRRENQWFLNKVNIIYNKREIYLKRKNDRLHIYKKCPKCKAILRLPHRIGKHQTVCPKCEHKFTVRVRK